MLQKLFNTQPQAEMKPAFNNSYFKDMQKHICICYDGKNLCADIKINCKMSLREFVF